MKKTYIQPSVEMMVENMTTMICSSVGVTANLGDNEEIGYGGVDNGGMKDPASRRRRSMWEDDEEFNEK